MREVVEFAAQCPAASSQVLSHTMPVAAWVRRLTVRIYPGPQLALRIQPLIVSVAGSEQPMLVYADGGKSWLDGDDDVWRYALLLPVGRGEALRVRVENLSPTHVYDWRVSVEVSRDE